MRRRKSTRDAFSEEGKAARSWFSYCPRESATMPQSAACRNARAPPYVNSRRVLFTSAAAASALSKSLGNKSTRPIARLCPPNYRPLWRVPIAFAKRQVTGICAHKRRATEEGRKCSQLKCYPILRAPRNRFQVAKEICDR